MPNLISLTLPCLQTLGKTQRMVFPDFWSFFINKNCHNSKISTGIGMKLGPVTKLDKRNTKTIKKIDDDVALATYDVINNFPIDG